MSKRKILSLIVCISLIAAFASCDSSDSGASKVATNTNSVESVLAGQMENSEEVTTTPTPTSTPTPVQEPKETAGGGEDGIDVDLTVLSSTMVYSEVYNMVFYPENYIGKRVKMSGSYMVFHDDATGKDYHACIISDATACCAQGIEFELAGEHRYPDDYPQLGDTVCVVGVFDIYWEGDQKYCTLRDAAMV